MADKRPADEMIDEKDSSQQSPKRLKSETSETRLLKFHDDLLESIFQWLDCNDLLAMIQVNDRFRQSINAIFVKKYENKLIKITLREYVSETSTSDVIVLKALPMIAPFLQYFGHYISKLHVEFNEKHSDQCLMIEQSILNYCDVLKELDLSYCRKGAFDAIKKPFETLEIFGFHNGYLGENISQFNKWFPKLRSLSICHATVADKSCIVTTMSLLNHLDIKIGSAGKKFSRGNIDDAISLNPQLRSIRLNNGCKPRDLRFVNGELKQLEKLEFWIHPENFTKGCTRPIQFKAVKQLVLDIYDRNFMSMDKFPLVCDKLEDLEVRCYFLNDQWFNFARKNNVTKLTLFVQYDGPSMNFLTKLASYWSNLKEVTIQLDDICADEVIQFITLCKNLKKLNISDESNRSPEKFDELRSKLGSEWELVPMITKCYYFDFKHSIIRK